MSLESIMLVVGVVLCAIVAASFFNNTAADGEDMDIRLKSLEEIKAGALKANCSDKAEADRCAQLAKSNGCDSAPGWMGVMCAATCNRCELLDPAIRCDPEKRGVSTESFFKPGDIGRMFSGLKEKYPEYNITYLSQPPNGPWIAQFDNFLSDAEIESLIVNTGMLQRSTDQGKFGEDGVQEQVVSTGRTSENAWCMHECEKQPLIRGVMDRISKITGPPVENFESFQLLRYQINQEYRRHHDMNDEDNKLLCGPRALTFFLYLSDVEEGGGTRFTELDITMYPKKGSAILWPSVLDDDPHTQDPMTFHQALPVIKGTKYAANSWIHQRNYKIPNLWGCTGAFT